MAPGSFRFDRFRLDLRDRQLWRDGVRVELNARYLDALALLVREQGRLVSKDRFLEEVWRGVPVTDEALTQCIRTLRRQLGDDAARPRFIETAPKHGYRFIAAVEDGALPLALPSDASRRLLVLGGAGMAGGGVAGVLGGLFYGFAGASQSVGAVSVLLVLACITMVLGLVAGAGVGLGVAAASLGAPRLGPWSIAGGAFGGMAVGAAVKLLGLDAFNLLFGQTPGDITGAAEGALLGGAVGVGVWLGGGLRRGLLAGGLAGAAVGVLIPLLGGRLLGGSLDLLARSFPHSRLPIGGLFGEDGFGPLTQGVTGALEGALFAACMVGALALAWRRLAGVAERRGRAEP